MFTVADVGFNYLGTSACLFNERNYKKKKKFHITLLTIHSVSGLTGIASSLQCSRTAFIGHDRETGSASNSATERRENIGQRFKSFGKQ